MLIASGRNIVSGIFEIQTLFWPHRVSISIGLNTELTVVRVSCINIDQKPIQGDLGMVAVHSRHTTELMKRNMYKQNVDFSIGGPALLYRWYSCIIVSLHTLQSAARSNLSSAW